MSGQDHPNASAAPNPCSPSGSPSGSVRPPSRPPSEGRRIVVLGGGFAGLYTARHLERQFRGDKSVHLTLVSRDNYFLLTPLLFEAGSGVLEPRHAVNPIRPLLERTRFVEADVVGLDLDRRVVHARPAQDEVFDLPYDHVVLALGGVVNSHIVPGADKVMTFKTLGDAIGLRNHVIQVLERADVEKDADRKRALLTFVVVGGGLVGVELVGELTEFLANAMRVYPHLKDEPVRIELIEGGPHLVPEFERELADYATDALKRRGVVVRTDTKVSGIEPPVGGNPGTVALPDGREIIAGTIVAAMGVLPSPVVAALPLEKDKKGRAVVEATMRSRSHPDVWALGDCASIPDPQGKPYPPLAQHALREARVLAHNITAAVREGDKARLKPFVYKSKGTLAALGHFKGVGRVYKFRIYGFFAWWVWRTYYLLQMPQWSRRLRIVLDWTIALMFKNDVVQLDFARSVARPAEQSTGPDGVERNAAERNAAPEPARSVAPKEERGDGHADGQHANTTNSASPPQERAVRHETLA